MFYLTHAYEFYDLKLSPLWFDCAQSLKHKHEKVSFDGLIMCLVLQKSIVFICLHANTNFFIQKIKKKYFFIT